MKVNQKAQGVIEYLVVLGVIVVIGLSVVSLISNIGPSEIDMVVMDSKAYWSTRSPVSIIDGKIDQDGNLFLTFRNNSTETIDLDTDALNIGGTTVSLVESTSLAPFAEKTVYAETGYTGSGGSLFSKNLKVTYSVSDTGLTKVISGEKELKLQYGY